MNAKEIKINAQLLCNRTIDKLNFFEYINEGIFLIAKSDINAIKVNTKTLDASKNIKYEIRKKSQLERKLLKLKKVINTDTNKEEEYKTYKSKVIFENNGKYKLFYILSPKRIISYRDIPNIKTKYHKQLSLFVAIKEREKYYDNTDKTIISLKNMYNKL